jgi:hypothetical protein
VSRDEAANKPRRSQAGAGGNENEHPVLGQYSTLIEWYRCRRLYLISIGQEYDDPEVERLKRARDDLVGLNWRAKQQIDRGEKRPSSHQAVSGSIPRCLS